MRKLSDCFNAKIHAPRLYCAKGHKFYYPETRYYLDWAFLKKHTRCTTCQDCKDFEGYEEVTQ